MDGEPTDGRTILWEVLTGQEIVTWPPDFSASKGDVRAGDQWWVALELKHDPTWHTYWINGGDAGIPTTLQWDLPAGIEAGPIHWAPPQIVKMGQLEVYGYEGRCLLLILSRPMLHSVRKAP